jgi:hypothetical protein
MDFISKIFRFLKNLHPIKNFAKPFPNRNPYLIETSAQPSNMVSISYESLVTATPTYQGNRPLYEAEPAQQSVIVIPKIEIGESMDFILESAEKIEEPVPQDAVIGDLVTSTLPEGIVLREVAIEVPVLEVVSEEIQPIVEKKKRRASKKPVKVKTPRLRSGQPTKKTLRQSSGQATKTRKKKNVPPEARGFGF